MIRSTRMFVAAAVGAAWFTCTPVSHAAPAGAARVPESRPVKLAPAPVLPAPVVKTLANGLEVAVFPDARSPIVQIQLLVRAGSSAEPDSAPGLAQLAAMLVDDGTSSRSAAQFASELGALGAMFSATANRDYALVACGVRAVSFEVASELVSDAAINAVMDDESFATARRAVAQQLGLQRQSATAVADDRLWNAAFGWHPYGHSPLGDIETLLGLRAEQVRAFYRSRWRPDHAVLTVSGAVSPERAFAVADEWFGRWSGRVTGDRVAPSFPATPVVRIVDLPGAQWSEARLLWIGAGRASADAASWTLAAAALDQASLPANARASLQVLRDASLLTVSFGAPTDSLPAVTRRVRDAVRAFAARPPAADALATLRRRAAQAFPLPLETLGACATQWLAAADAGMGADALAKQYERLGVASIEPALQRLAGPPAILVAGPGEALSGRLSSLGDVQVVPYHRLTVAKPDTLPAPTAEQARRGKLSIAAAVLAHGGAAKLAAAKTLVQEGEMMLFAAGQEYEGQFSHVRVDPDRMSLATRMLQFESRQVLVADSAWTLTQGDTAAILPVDSVGVRALQASLRGDLVHLLRQAQLPGARPARRGTETIKGKPCELVDFVGADGVRWRFALDATTHRVVAIDGELGEGLRWKERRVYSQFGPVGGLVLPSIEERFAEGERLSRFTTDRASVNQAIDPALFLKPRVIRGVLVSE
ncbi:MAG: pitrilysin family protein [Candidatus Eisenbacteria bacterium]